MSIKKSMYLGATRSVVNTTSTGAGTSIATPPLSTIVAQVVVNGTGAGSFTVEGSLDGATWSTIVAATTYTGNRIVKSSTIAPVTYVRARITAHGSTKDVNIYLAGR